MGLNGNNGGDTNISDEGEAPITNPRARILLTPENPRGYPPFDLRLVPNYTNNQLTHYYATGAISVDDQPRFHQLMKQRKTSLDLLGWNGESDTETIGRSTRNDPETPPLNSNSGTDSDYPTPLPGYKGIKISPSDIPKLRYNSTVAQYGNWLADLKTAFDGDPAKRSEER